MPLVASYKKFNYTIAYYTRDEVESNSPTQRKASTFTVETSNATRAITAFKREVQGAVILAVVPDNEDGKYDVGPVEVTKGSGLFTDHS